MQLIRFSVIGILNSLLDFGILNALMIGFGVTLGLPLVLCNAAAFIVANLNGYFFNKRWTFGRREDISDICSFPSGGSLSIAW